jgi:hypothetical protein
MAGFYDNSAEVENFAKKGVELTVQNMRLSSRAFVLILHS